MSELSERNVRRLTEVQAKLLSMGVRDTKLYRDAERWNVMSMNERATLLCDIFEAWMRGDCSPMKPLNDSHAVETSAPLADEDGPGEEDGPWAEGWAERSGACPDPDEETP